MGTRLFGLFFVSLVALSGLWFLLKPVAPVSSEPQTRYFELDLGDGTAWLPSRYSVRQGDSIEFVVQSSVDDAMHIHGYELHVPLPANSPQSVEFSADKVGQFQLELHGTELQVGTLEVYPRP